MKQVPGFGGQQRPDFTGYSKCPGISKRFTSKILEVGRTVRGYPAVLVWPLLLLSLLLGLGIWGVTWVVDADKDTAKLRAISLARDTATWYVQQLSLAVVPVTLLSAIVRYKPQYEETKGLFLSLAPTLVSQTPPGSTECVELVPNGVVGNTYPEAGNEAALGYDLFESPLDRDGAMRTVKDGIMTLVGPIPFVQGGMGVIVRQPIFVKATGNNETFGIPKPLSGSCGGPCSYDSVSQTKFWGFAAALISLRHVSGSDSRLTALHDRGYEYELLAPNVTTGMMGVVASSSRHALSSDAVDVAVPLPNTQWVLRVYPTNGWSPRWFGGMLAGVILMSLSLSALMFAVLVSRRQHQLLLKALLPKDIIRELRKDATTAMETRIMRAAETPADMLLNMMGELLEGQMPDLRDVVFIRTALLRNMDVYQPLNLQRHLKGSCLDADVVRALMQQLGNVADMDPGSMEPCKARRECSSQEHDSSAALHAGQGDCGTLGGAMHLILSVQPYSCINVFGEGGDTSFYSQWGPRDVESGAGMTIPATTSAALAVDASDRISCSLGRWRGRRTTPAHSGNGHTRPSALLPPLTISSAMIDEAERLLAQVDGWHFNTWELQEATQGHALSVLGFYLIQRAGLISRFRLKPSTLARLLRQVEAGYLDQPYHNSTHAADVLQTLHVIIHTAQLQVHYLDPLGLLAAYYAAMVHDYSHPGLTSDFLVATSDPLAVRYNDRSPLENHHCAASFSLLQRPELDVLAPLSKSERGSFRKQVIELVLATDMKQHFSILSHFNTVHRLSAYTQQQPAGSMQRANSLPRSTSLKASGIGPDKLGLVRPSPLAHPHTAPQPVDDTERLLTLQLALKCADIGHLGEALEVHKRWLGVLEEEFFRQGDRERDLGLPISPLFDRAKQGVSKSQVGFYDFVALPLTHALTSAFPGAQPLMKCFLSNYDHWRALDTDSPVESPKSKLVASGSGRVASPPQLTLSASDRNLGVMRSLSKSMQPAQASASTYLDKPRSQSPRSQRAEAFPPMVKLTLTQD